MRGVFGELSGELRYDPEAPDVSSVVVVIAAASVDTGNGNRDEHLRSSDFFHVAEYPEIVFQSDSVRFSESTAGILYGPLTIRGVTRPVEIPFERTHAEPTVELFGRTAVLFEGGLRLDRKAFGVQANARWNQLVAATGELAMSDSVDIELRAVAMARRER